MPTGPAVMALWAAVAAASADRPAEEKDVAPATVALTPARTRLLYGTASEIDVSIDVAGPEAASFKPIRALATVGVLEMPRPGGAPGHFTARYLPPPHRFPEVALLVVELASGSRRVLASARIALEGSTVVPLHTSPGASVVMRVAERVFGPVVADRQGHVEIPIEVPPGARVGQARAVDHSGAARETEVDLQLPPFPRVLVVAPPTLEVGTFAEIAVLAVDADGTPTAAGGLTLGASDGFVHPRGPGPAGEARFLFEAPRRVAGGAVALTATASGTPAARADLAVPLQAAGPARLALVPSVRRLVVGSGESARISISVRDAFGNPTTATGLLAAKVDGEPRVIGSSPDGTATISVSPPASFSGRDRIDVAVSLGALQAAEEIHLTGGAPARLTMEVRSARVVADGQQSTELHVQAVDRNGTPTMVPGLSWETPEGRVRHVRVPRDGEYLAEYVPDRTREPRRDVVAVMASHDLRADASVEATPPPIRLVGAARAGLYSNFGHAAGVAVFLEALRPIEVRGARFQVGVTAGYLHGDQTATGFPPPLVSAQIDLDQVPILAVARWRAALPLRFDVAADVMAGFSWAETHIDTIAGTAAAWALGAGAEISLPLKPGRLVIGLRYLRIDLGRTSQGDVFLGNCVGLVGDLGYKMTF